MAAYLRGMVTGEKLTRKLGVRSTLLQGLKKDNGATEEKARVSGLHGLLHK